MVDLCEVQNILLVLILAGWLAIRSRRIWLLVFQELEYGSMDSVMYLPLRDPNPVGELDVAPQRKCLAEHKVFLLLTT